MSPARIATPAFACLKLDGNQPGMSVRLYIATEAMAALIAECSHPQSVGSLNQTKSIAIRALGFADAMIAEDAK